MGPPIAKNLMAVGMSSLLVSTLSINTVPASALPGQGLPTFSLPAPGQYYDKQANLSYTYLREDESPQNDCEAQALKDEAVCRNLPNITKVHKAVRNRCWASVHERFGACRAKRPLPPLITH